MVILMYLSKEVSNSNYSFFAFDSLLFPTVQSSLLQTIFIDSILMLEFWTTVLSGKILDRNRVVSLTNTTLLNIQVY